MGKLTDSFFGRKRWYLAEEADKVIAEKDATIYVRKYTKIWLYAYF